MSAADAAAPAVISPEAFLAHAQALVLRTSVGCRIRRARTTFP